MRITRSWNLVDNGNLTNRLEIASGVLVELINFIVWMQYTGSSSVTPHISLFKEEYGFGSGVLGEEVYVGLGRNMWRISFERIESMKFETFVRN